MSFLGEEKRRYKGRIPVSALVAPRWRLLQGNQGGYGDPPLVRPRVYSVREVRVLFRHTLSGL